MPNTGKILMKTRHSNTEQGILKKIRLIDSNEITLETAKVSTYNQRHCTAVAKKIQIPIT